MLSKRTISIREANLDEDTLIAQHFYQLWRDNNVPEHCIRSNWLEVTVQFINHAREELHYKAFIAEVSGTVIGSAGCQLFTGLYPHVLADAQRKYGYIWGVYVEPPHRSKGIAKQLTGVARDYLKSLGCTQAILHASPLGRPLYSSLGFVESNEMRLDLF